MEKYQIPIPFPKYGINCIDDSLIADNEAAEGTKNISFKDGIPQTRKGYIKGSPFNFATEVQTLYNYVKGSTKYLLAACGTGLKKQNGVSFDNIAGVLNTDKIECLTYPYKFANPDTYTDKCFILDGLNYRYYDGGAALVDVTAYAPSVDEQTAYGTNVLTTTPDEVKKQKYLLNDDNRIWVAGYDKIVRISHLYNPAYFPSTQIWKLQEACTGISRFKGEVFLFTPTTTTLISGSTVDWTLPDKYVRKDLPGGYGCDAHRSIAATTDMIIWANKNGVYAYEYLPTGYSVPRCLSEQEIVSGNKRHTRSVKKFLTGITDWTKVFAEFYDSEYRLYIGNKQVLVYDTIAGSWALYEYNRTFKASLVMDNVLYYGSSYLCHMDYSFDPYGTTWDGLNDDGDAIEYELIGKFFDFNKAANKKKFKELFVTLYAEIISYKIWLYANLDNDVTKVKDPIVNKASRWGQFAFGDKVNVKRTNLNFPIKLHHKGKKYNIQFRLSLNELNMAFMLISLELLMKVKELK